MELLTILFQDPITRADAANLGADYILPKGYTQHLGVFSNGVDTTAAGDCGDLIDASISWPNDQYMQAVVVTVGTGESLLWVRGEGVVGADKDGYLAGTDAGNFGNNNTHIEKRVNDAFTDLGDSGAVDISGGSTVRVESEATTIRIKVGGVQKLSVTDASHAAGKPGFSAIHATNVRMYDDVEAGDLVPIVPSESRKWTHEHNVSLQQRMGVAA